MRTIDELLTLGKEIIGDYALSSDYPETNRLDIYVDSINLKSAVSKMVENQWGYLVTITGLDHPPKYDDAGNLLSDGKIEGLYHFANWAAIITLRISVEYSNPKIDSICEIIPSATLYERELIELFGFDIFDTPDSSRLVLPDIWPENSYPLRKSFTGIQQDQSAGKAS